MNLSRAVAVVAAHVLGLAGACQPTRLVGRDGGASVVDSQACSDLPCSAAGTCAPCGDISGDVAEDLGSPRTAADALGPCAMGCNDGNLCTYDLCDAKAGLCRALPLPASTTCESDGDPCTAQWCDGAGQCVVYSTGECL